MYYAQIANGKVYAVTETHSAVEAPDMIPLQSFDVSLIGSSYADGVFTPPPPPPVQQHATKRAFQNRFPKMPNGISTKFDAMSMFLADDGYAASLGVTGAALYELRMLITTGVQRMNASLFVDMAPTAEAAALTGLLMQPAIPAAFRLSAAERSAMLDTPLADAERYTG